MQCKEITDYCNCICIMWQFYSALFALFAKRNYAYTMNVNNFLCCQSLKNILLFLIKTHLPSLLFLKFGWKNILLVLIFTSKKMFMLDEKNRRYLKFKKLILWIKLISFFIFLTSCLSLLHESDYTFTVRVEWNFLGEDLYNT